MVPGGHRCERNAVPHQDRELCDTSKARDSVPSWHGRPGEESSADDTQGATSLLAGRPTRLVDTTLPPAALLDAQWFSSPSDSSSRFSAIEAKLAKDNFGFYVICINCLLWSFYLLFVDKVSQNSWCSASNIRQKMSLK